MSRSQTPVPACGLNLSPNQHSPEQTHSKQPPKHVVCFDIWELIFDIVQGFNDVNVPPIFAACARVCRDLRRIAEVRLYKNIILGDKPTVKNYLFWETTPICTTGISYLLKDRHMETADRVPPTQFPLNGNYPIRQRSAAALLPPATKAWYSLHPIEFYHILKQFPHLGTYIGTVHVWPSENNGYDDNAGELFSYLLNLPVRKLAFHEFANGLPYYIMDHVENTIVGDLDFSGVKNFQVNSLLNLTPLRRLGLATIDTEIVNPICDLEFAFKVDLETLAIDFSDWQSSEKYYRWFSSPACPISATSIVSLELTWVPLQQLVMTSARGLFEPIYWLFMALININNLSIQVSDTMTTNGGDGASFRPYPRLFRSIPSDEDFSNYGAYMTTSGLTTSGLESLNRLQAVTFTGTFYNLSTKRFTDVNTSNQARTCLPAFRTLLQSLKQRKSPSAITRVAFLMDFDYLPIFTSFPGPLKLPVLSEWKGIVDMLLSQAHCPDLEKVVFTIKQLPKHAKEGEATRIKEAFSALSDIRRLIDKNLFVWKD